MPRPSTRHRTSRDAELKTKPKAKSTSKPKAKSASKLKSDIAALKVCIANLADEIAEQETMQKTMILKSGMVKFHRAVGSMFAHRKIAVDYWKIITNLTFAELEVARQISEMMFEHDGEMTEATHMPKDDIAELELMIVDLEVFSDKMLENIFDEHEPEPLNYGKMEKIAELKAANAELNAAIAKFAEKKLFSDDKINLTVEEIKELSPLANDDMTVAACK
jgi:hypothetical protein